MKFLITYNKDDFEELTSPIQLCLFDPEDFGAFDFWWAVSFSNNKENFRHIIKSVDADVLRDGYNALDLHFVPAVLKDVCTDPRIDSYVIIQDSVPVKVVNKGRHDYPAYKIDGDSGLDIRANIDDDIILGTLERTAVPTGLYVELPYGYEFQVRPRSGLTIKHGVIVGNSPGTVDCNYRGEIMVILINASNEPFVIHDGDRIAQLVLAEWRKVNWIPVTEIAPSERGEGKFGHTGLK